MSKYHELCERKVCLDTETTGKSDDGTPGDHRVIEIGCVEILGRKPTGRELQIYLNPERPVDEEAFNVHHISDEFLKNKPKFSEVYQQFYDFIVGSELIIHNAKFDVGFLNHEMELIGKNVKIENICQVTDTLEVAKEKFPGQHVSLDALCTKLDVDESARTSHGALLDAQILSEVYLAMTGGQESLFTEGPQTTSVVESFDLSSYKKTKIQKPSIFEKADHILYLLRMNNPKAENNEILFGDEYKIKFLEKEKDGKVVKVLNEDMIQEALRKLLEKEYPNEPDAYDRYIKFSQERQKLADDIKKEKLALKKEELEEAKRRERESDAKAGIVSDD